MITYQEERIADILDELIPLTQVHWKEIARHQDKIELDPDYDKYLLLEDMGMIYTYTIRIGGKLAGYAIFMVSPHLHYKQSTWAINDILYLQKENRGVMMGVKLIKFSELALKQRGVAVMTVHSKVDFDMSSLLERQGFERSESIHDKYIGD